MKRVLKHILFVLLLILTIIIAARTHTPPLLFQKDERANQTMSDIPPSSAPTPAPSIAEPSSISPQPQTIEYEALMIAAACNGDMGQLRELCQSRSEAIQIGQLSGEPLNADEYIYLFESCYGFNPVEDYVAMIKMACARGDPVVGVRASDKFALRAELLQDGTIPFSFDDLTQLSRVITVEAGSSWLPEAWRLAVGEVVLNRVASPEFPDSIGEVLSQEGQYPQARQVWFQYMLPFTYCVDAAFSLLQGERVLNDPSVVFQAGFPQGGGIAKQFTDSILGTTYFCYSSHPELYK